MLVGAFHAMAANPGAWELMTIVSTLTDPVDPDFVREFQESTVAQPVPDGFLDGIVAESCKLPARVWQAYLEDYLASEAPTRTGTIAAPTLILWGDQDAYCPRSDQDALAAAIPGARLVVYRGTAHTPHWEQPARTSADLAGFVRQLAPAAAVVAG